MDHRIITLLGIHTAGAVQQDHVGAHLAKVTVPFCIDRFNRTILKNSLSHKLLLRWKYSLRDGQPHAFCQQLSIYRHRLEKGFRII